MSFTAIWISPFVEQATDSTQVYNGYWAQNMYSLDSNFGTADDLLPFPYVT
jgi:alpha-amylase